MVRVCMEGGREGGMDGSIDGWTDDIDRLNAVTSCSGKTQTIGARLISCTVHYKFIHDFCAVVQVKYLLPVAKARARAPRGNSPLQLFVSMGWICLPPPPNLGYH